MDVLHKKKLSEIVKKGSIKFVHDLKQLTTIKIGGPAEVLIQTADKAELKSVLLLSSTEHIPFFVLGGGSNVLFPSEGYRGIVIKLPHTPHKVMKPDKKVILSLGGGSIVNLVASRLAEEGYTGFENMFGLPGTMGGAIFMNSKWPQNTFQTSDCLETVTYITRSGELVTFSKNELHFNYGFSDFQKKDGIIIESTCVIHELNTTDVKKKCLDVQQYRRSTQPTGVFTAGCVFKNISEFERNKHQLPTCSAGYLIDQAGFKGYQCGGLTVSSVHANFFINSGSATSMDYQHLLELIKEKVSNKFGINLKDEVLFVNL